MVPWILIAWALGNAALAKVTGPNFAGCQRSFYSYTPPAGLERLPNEDSMASICVMMKRNAKTFYAVLYQRKSRIPLYSAYILDRRTENSTRATDKFQLEPQLVSRRLPPYMMTLLETANAIRAVYNISGDPKKFIIKTQAVNSDYNNTGYDKGHLNPDAHHPKGEAKYATYTLVNVVPMNLTLNRGQWRLYEERVKNLTLTLNCTTMYVITGVVNGQTWISNNRVNVPSHIWSAYCCVGPNDKPISTRGVWASNNASNVNRVTIPNLQSWLNGQLGVNINLFQNNCA